MRTRKVSLAWSILAIVTLLSLVLAACGPKPTEAPPPTEVPTEAPTAPPPTEAPEVKAEGAPYKIGFASAITGPASSLGVPERDCAEMLAQEVTEIVGPDGVKHPLEIIIYDTEGAGETAVTVVNKMISEDEVVAVVAGSRSPVSVALVPVTAEAEVPYVSMASSSAIVEPVEEHYWAFKTPQSNDPVAYNQVEYLKHLGVTKIASLYVNDAFGEDSRAGLQKWTAEAGIEILLEESFEAEDADMTAQLTKVKASDAEALVVHAIPPAASIITTQFQELGLDIPLIHNHGVCNKTFIELAGVENAEGTIFPCGKMLVAEGLPDADPQKQVLLDFIADYEAFSGNPRSTFAGHAWDAFQLVFSALGNLPDGLSLEEQRAAVRDYIENETAGFVGTGGVFQISSQDHNGLGPDSMTLLKVAEGEWTYFGPEAWEVPAVAAVEFKVGMVSDVGGIDDASFNENTWKGLQDAQDYLGVEATFLESQAQADYENNITEFAEQGYNMIITVGFLLGDATYKMAAQYPDVKFAIVDYPSGDEETPNLQGILFNVHEASFPVGYVAAAMADQLDPDDPMVAYIGGMQIPPVEEFIVAYEAGVNYYNEKYGKDVKFTGVYVGDFEAPDQGKTQANSLIDEGADIIMGVGGKTGNGGITAAKERGKWGVGVDVDQYYTLPNEKDILVTSTIKRLDKAVFSVIKSAVEGTFEGGTNYFATLENEGVGVGPFHDFEDKVPDEIKADLEQIQKDIIAGKISTGWPPE